MKSESMHASASASAWYAKHIARGTIRHDGVDAEAFLYHLALLIKSERAAAILARSEPPLVVDPGLDEDDAW
jgi:hypothetical protein